MNNRAVVALYFSPDGKEVASGSDDSTIRVWSTSSGELLRTLKHNDFVRDVRYSPNGQLMCSASWDATARIWRVSTRNSHSQSEPIFDIPNCTNFTSFSSSPFPSLSLTNRPRTASV